jgi:hypothetical protein
MMLLWDVRRSAGAAQLNWAGGVFRSRLRSLLPALGLKQGKKLSEKRPFPDSGFGFHKICQNSRQPGKIKL